MLEQLLRINRGFNPADMHCKILELALKKKKIPNSIDLQQVSSLKLFSSLQKWLHVFKQKIKILNAVLKRLFLILKKLGKWTWMNEVQKFCHIKQLQTTTTVFALHASIPAYSLKGSGTVGKEQKQKPGGTSTTKPAVETGCKLQEQLPRHHTLLVWLTSSQ